MISASVLLAASLLAGRLADELLIDAAGLASQEVGPGSLSDSWRHHHADAL